MKEKWDEESYNAGHEQLIEVVSNLTIDNSRCH
jgi:hypothetical protein